MSGTRRDWLEAAVKVVVAVVMLAPLMPDARTRWYLAMCACRNAARQLGLCAIVAENRYRKEID